MYKLCAALALIAITYRTGSASPVTPCASGSLQSYLTLSASGCSVGDLEFSGFNVFSAEGGSSPLDPSAVSVSPVANGLQFTFDSFAASSQFLDIVYGFNVNPITGAGISGDSLTLFGSSATLDGGVAGLEVSCVGAISPGGACSGATAGRNLAVYSLDGLSQTADQASFASAALLGITLDFSSDGGSAGSATLGSAAAQFVETAIATPEPGTMWLAFFACAGLAVWRVRKQSTQS